MRISVNSNASEVSASMRVRGLQLVPEMLEAMDGEASDLVSYIVDNKLSGQVLRRRSGRLASSVHRIDAEIVGGSLVGGVVAAEGDAWYGKLHEFGYQGVSWIRKWRGHMHPSHFNIPERSFMRSSLAEQRDLITARLRQRMREVIEG